MDTNIPTPRRILLVDDEVGLRTLLTRVFRHAGYEVESAGDGQAGLECFRKGSWSVVVIDRAMPVMNGEELAAALRALSPQTPLIMITGLLSRITQPHLFDLILEKPFHPADILDCVARVTR